MASKICLCFFLFKLSKNAFLGRAGGTTVVVGDGSDVLLVVVVATDVDRGAIAVGGEENVGMSTLAGAFVPTKKPTSSTSTKPKGPKGPKEL